MFLIVAQRLHANIQKVVSEVAAELRVLGHDLEHYTNSIPGDISLRDDNYEDGVYICRLRLGVDTIVSVGFGDTVESSDEDDPSLYFPGG